MAAAAAIVSESRQHEGETMTTQEIELTRPARTQQWMVDPDRTTVEFAVRHWWGLATVKGRLHRFEGSYVPGTSIELDVDARSVDTGNRTRDKHLRAADFFDIEEHPTVSFTSTRVVEAEPGRLHVSGDLEVAGVTQPLAFDASIRELGDELEVEVTTIVDQRVFGMSSGPLWNVRPPTALHVKARLVPAVADQEE
jgi:polyisoprenoid-binding protein YceI